MNVAVTEFLWMSCTGLGGLSLMFFSRPPSIFPVVGGLLLLVCLFSGLAVIEP